MFVAGRGIIGCEKAALQQRVLNQMDNLHDPLPATMLETVHRAHPIRRLFALHWGAGYMKLYSDMGVLTAFGHFLCNQQFGSTEGQLICPILIVFFQ